MLFERCVGRLGCGSSRCEGRRRICRRRTRDWGRLRANCSFSLNSSLQRGVKDVDAADDPDQDCESRRGEFLQTGHEANVKIKKCTSTANLYHDSADSAPTDKDVAATKRGTSGNLLQGASLVTSVIRSKSANFPKRQHFLCKKICNVTEHYANPAASDASTHDGATRNTTKQRCPSAQRPLFATQRQKCEHYRTL